MMPERHLPSLSRRMLTTQMQVTTLAGLTLLASVVVIAPDLFADHLAATGETDPLVQSHAEEAFRTSGAIALTVALVVALAASAVLFRIVGRRISRPIEELAQGADALGSRNFDVTVPDRPFSDEVDRLGSSLERMGSQLADTERTRTRLLSDLAHEMRTPLATLELYAESLRDELVPREDALATIEAQILRLQRLAQDLREVALAEEHALAMETADVELGELVTSACLAIAPRLAAAGIDLQQVPASGPIAMPADPIRLQQVLANILDNALRHTPSGGRVTVSVGRASADAVIRITDTGEGIPTEELERIFERFYRVDPSRLAADGSGSGLGLTIARAIVEAHGGTLRAASDGAGRGTTMIVSLPTSAAGPAAR